MYRRLSSKKEKRSIVQCFFIVFGNFDSFLLSFKKKKLNADDLLMMVILLQIFINGNSTQKPQHNIPAKFAMAGNLDSIV